MRISSERGYFFHDHREREVGRAVKEKLCYIAFDYDTETQIDCRMFRQEADVARVFFQPISLALKPAESTTLLHHNFRKCDVDIRVNLYVHVMLLGGTTMFQEIGQRMTKESDGVAFTHDEDQGGCSTRETVLGADGRVYFGFFFYKCGSRGCVRWIWPDHRVDATHLGSTV